MTKSLKVFTRKVRNELKRLNIQQKSKREAYMLFCRYVLDNTTTEDKSAVNYSRSRLNINLITKEEPDVPIKAMSFEAFKEVYQMIRDRNSNSAIEKKIREKLKSKLLLSEVRRGAYTQIWRTIPDEEEHHLYNDLEVLIDYQNVALAFRNSTQKSVEVVVFRFVKTPNGCKIVYEKSGEEVETVVVPNLNYEDLAANEFIEAIRHVLVPSNEISRKWFDEIKIRIEKWEEAENDDWITKCLFPPKVNHWLRQRPDKLICAKQLYLDLHLKLHEDDQTLSLTFMRPKKLKKLTLRLWRHSCDDEISDHAIPAFLKRWMIEEPFKGLKTLDIDQEGIIGCRTAPTMPGKTIIGCEKDPADRFVTVPKQQTPEEILTFLKEQLEYNANPERAFKNLCRKMSNETFVPGFKPKKPDHSFINLLREDEENIYIKVIPFETVEQVFVMLNGNEKKSEIEKYIKDHMNKKIRLSELREWAYLYSPTFNRNVPNKTKYEKLTVMIGYRKIWLTLLWADKPSESVLISFRPTATGGCRIMVTDDQRKDESLTTEEVPGLNYQDLAANEFAKIVKFRMGNNATFGTLVFKIQSAPKKKEEEIKLNQEQVPEASQAPTTADVHPLPDVSLSPTTADVHPLPDVSLSPTTADVNPILDASKSATTADAHPLPDACFVRKIRFSTDLYSVHCKTFEVMVYEDLIPSKQPFDLNLLSHPKEIKIRTWSDEQMKDKKPKNLKRLLRNWSKEDVWKRATVIGHLAVDKFDEFIGKFSHVYIGKYDKERLVKIINLLQKEPPKKDCLITFENDTLPSKLKPDEKILIMFKNNTSIVVIVGEHGSPLEKADELLGCSLIEQLGITYPFEKTSEESMEQSS